MRGVLFGVSRWRKPFFLALSCTVTDRLHDEDNTVALMATMGKRLVEELGAAAIVLGCGATTGPAAHLGRELDVPVLNPALTAAGHARMLASLGLP